MNEETARQNKIRIALSEVGTTNWRNNTGLGWAGKMIKGVGKMMFVGKYDVVIKDARPLRAGLCKGSSDIIAIKPVLITPEMVGQTIGQFIAVEVKTLTGKATKDQLNFNKQINDKGGIALIARDVEDIKTL
jgi:hypothetical protein